MRLQAALEGVAPPLSLRHSPLRETQAAQRFHEQVIGQVAKAACGRCHLTGLRVAHRGRSSGRLVQVRSRWRAPVLGC